MEKIELENLNRIERLLTVEYGELPKGLINNVDRIRQDLLLYEIDDRLLARIADTMHQATLADNIKEAEALVKYLVDTFWQQNY